MKLILPPMSMPIPLVNLLTAQPLGEASAPLPPPAPEAHHNPEQILNSSAQPSPVSQIIKNIVHDLKQKHAFQDLGKTQEFSAKETEKNLADSSNKLETDAPTQPIELNTSLPQQSPEQTVKPLAQTLVNQGHLEPQILTAPPQAMIQASLNKLGELAKREKKALKKNKEKHTEQKESPLDNLLRQIMGGEEH